MLTGELPMGRFEPPSQKAQIDARLDEVVLHSLERDVKRRYQNARDIKTDVESISSGRETTPRRELNIKLWLAWTGVAIMAVVVGGVLLLALVKAKPLPPGPNANKNAKTPAAEKTAATDAGPGLFEPARLLVEDGKFEEALARISTASSQAPKNAGYLEQRGNILQTLLRFKEAGEVYKQALALKTDLPAAAENLKFCERLAGADLKNPSPATGDLLEELREAMIRQGRPAEALAIAPHVTQTSDATLASWQRVLDNAGLRRRLKRAGDAFYDLDLQQSGAVDLSVLKGMPLAQLSVIACSELSNLEPLRGMPLEDLKISRTKVSDLAPVKGMKLKLLLAAMAPIQDVRPLAGMPLEFVDIQGTQVTDIAPLKGMQLNTLQLVTLKINDFTPVKGMPLTAFAASHFTNLSLLNGAPLVALTLVESGDLTDLTPLKGKKLGTLNLGGASVSDLRPLAGMPLHVLGLRGCPIRDLAPLAGMSIERLRLEDTLLADLRPLAGIKVTELILTGCANVRDVSPLAQCRELENLSLPANAQNVESLRQMPGLKKLIYPADNNLSINWANVQPVEQFWKDYDVRRGGKGK